MKRWLLALGLWSATAQAESVPRGAEAMAQAALQPQLDARAARGARDMESVLARLRESLGELARLQAPQAQACASELGAVRGQAQSAQRDELGLQEALAARDPARADAVLSRMELTLRRAAQAAEAVRACVERERTREVEPHWVQVEAESPATPVDLRAPWPDLRQRAPAVH